MASALGRSILDAGVLPVMVLKDTALEHNLELMASYCREHGVLLAPHAKTTMAPSLIARQSAHGAWGITLATASQVRIARHFGAWRILLATQLCDRASIAYLTHELEADAGFDLVTLVDSTEGVGLLDEERRALGATRALPVLVELGHKGGRTGVRSVAEGLEVADAVRDAPSLSIAGVEGFEGSITAPSFEERSSAVRRYLAELRALHLGLQSAGHYDGLERAIVSAGGSAFFDLVVEELTGWPGDLEVQTMLRSGCYLTHDVEMYEQSSPFGARGQHLAPPTALGSGRAGSPSDRPRRLLPALELWAVIISRPEPGLAILNFGRRDAPFDAGLPVPRLLWARGAVGPPVAIDDLGEVVRLNDQHAFLELSGRRDVGIGDKIGFGISHPCTAFDKWPLVPLVDDGYLVLDGVRTYF